jgi:hypothetical protein
LILTPSCPFAFVYILTCDAGGEKREAETLFRLFSLFYSTVVVSAAAAAAAVMQTSMHDWMIII